jgi:glucosylceramidase
MHTLRLIVFGLVASSSLAASQHRTEEQVSTTVNAPWQLWNDTIPGAVGSQVDAEINVSAPLQTIEGFGTCFNELGWTSLGALSQGERDSVLRELFSPGVGANFTVCRMPVGANDFSLDWYSYDESEGDFEMKNFSIANDLRTLVPFIKAARKLNPSLQLWASPWSPPSWMKYNKHYAMTTPPEGSLVDNGMRADQRGTEGTDMFIQDERYFRAYALYFSKFIDAYREQGIAINMVMPQNEFNSIQIFPSCAWTAKGLATFLRYLCPAMQERKVDVFFGTMERPNGKLVDTILTDPGLRPCIKGIAFQWAGKQAIAGIHRRYPTMTLYQSEQECGDGKNDWQYCTYAWTLMKHYLKNGASAYLYWNTSLQRGGVSRWGWSQNSLISVDTTKHTFRYNHEYYLMKHFSHYVQSGARLLQTAGPFGDLLAFLNPDRSLVIVVRNELESARPVRIKVGKRTLAPLLPGDSFTTIAITAN